MGPVPPTVPCWANKMSRCRPDQSPAPGGGVMQGSLQGPLGGWQEGVGAVSVSVSARVRVHYPPSLYRA